ncbi:putative damage-inducible protein DinB [Ureibacillus chungkukjangi]|uniref:Putative damage-inducible protein DinB n=2 Tax=Ureibacillus chungkukjangi TaxID=1202712 RepID=A0A318TIY9_9BACL|nr:putative damage-inducible protein DinB [Ureibacillus chungkukjangi]
MMYRNLNDFIQEWERNCGGTLAIYKAIMDDKKQVAIVEGHSSLESLAWHLTTSPAYFMGQVGFSLNVELNPQNTPATISEIISTYSAVSENIVKLAKENLSDEKLLTEVNSHGHQTPIGALLRMMVDHQTHHRAQMQVLLRQAGLPVPGVMGPTKEDLAK